MAVAAASTSNATQALNLNSARVEHSASAIEARCSRKSGKTSLFRRLVPRFLASCLPIAPAPAAKAPRPEVGSTYICCLAAQQYCVLCVIVRLCGMALWQQRQQGCHCILWDDTVATMAANVPHLCGCTSDALQACLAQAWAWQGVSTWLQGWPACPA